MLSPQKSEKITRFRGNRLADQQMCSTEIECLEGTESKSLHAVFTVLFYVLTQLEGASISLASAPIPHYLAGGGDRWEKEGPGEDMLREKED